MRFHFFSICLMGLALAAPLHAQTLTVADGAKSSTLSRDALLARKISAATATAHGVPARIVGLRQRRRARFLLASSPKRTGVSS
jgi:hypothetical protein